MNVPSRLLKNSPLAGVTTNPGPAPTTTTTMKRTPRHTLLQTAAALTLLLPALTACTIVSRTVPAADEPITFASFLPDVTKAVVKSEADMTEFAVWGWHTADDATGADQTAIFDGEKVSRDGAGSPWTYDVPRFWVEGHYDFYALYPYPADGSGVTATRTVDGITSIALNSPNADIDLMTATATRNYPDEGDGAVAFTFDHLLSRVSFVAATGSDNIDIISLTLSNIALDGTYDPAAASDHWTCGTADGSILAEIPKSGLPLNSETATGIADWLFIPQTLSVSPGTPASATVVYTISGVPETKYITLPQEPIWAAGKHYKYVLYLGMTDVTLNIYITPWDASGTTNEVKW